MPGWYFAHVQDVMNLCLYCMFCMITRQISLHISTVWPEDLCYLPAVFFSSPELCSGWAILITFRPSSIRPSMHASVHLSVRPSVNIFKVTSPLKPLSQFCSNFIQSLLRLGEQKIAKMVAVHWPRWPPCPYMIKTFKNLLLQNRGCLGAESLHKSSGTGGLPKLLK